MSGHPPDWRGKTELFSGAYCTACRRDTDADRISRRYQQKTDRHRHASTSPQYRTRGWRLAECNSQPERQSGTLPLGSTLSHQVEHHRRIRRDHRAVQRRREAIAAPSRRSAANWREPYSLPLGRGDGGIDPGAHARLAPPAPCAIIDAQPAGMTTRPATIVVIAAMNRPDADEHRSLRGIPITISEISWCIQGEVGIGGTVSWRNRIAQHTARMRHCCWRCSRAKTGATGVR
jgi:hypothetical protein